jgi:hypothetical protein
MKMGVRVRCIEQATSMSVYIPEVVVLLVERNQAGEKQKMFIYPSAPRTGVLLHAAKFGSLAPTWCWTLVQTHRGRSRESSSTACYMPAICAPLIYARLAWLLFGLEGLVGKTSGDVSYLRLWDIHGHRMKETCGAFTGCKRPANRPSYTLVGSLLCVNTTAVKDLSHTAPIGVAFVLWNWIL